MMFDVIISETARNQIEILSSEKRRRVLDALERARIRPEKYSEKIVGFLGFKMRVGEFRLILDIHQGNIFVLSMRKKKDMF